MAYGDQKFRHGLRNVRNSIGLALRAYEISNDTEKIELLGMLMQTADEAITMIESALAESPDTVPPSPPSPSDQA